jgi:Flp pilus assembly protein TadG
MKTPNVPAHRRNQRGVALTYFGIIMLVLMAFTVIGIDVGRLGFAASEVQSVADVAATAAALAKMQGSSDPVAQARVAIQANKVDGDAADVGAGLGVESITPGRWDFEDKTFTVLTWDDATVNAAKAVGLKTVDNFIAGLFGSNQSSVTREAIAAIGGSCSGRSVMPIAVGDCFFEQFAQGDPSDPNRCSGLPTITMKNDKVDNACFTSLGPTSSSASKTVSYLPTSCCQGGNCGGAAPSPLVTIGDDINLMNGVAASVLQIIEDCVENDGLTEWDIPIVKCNETAGCPNGAAECLKCNQNEEVTGFVHIVIENVQHTGASKEIRFRSMCKVTPSGGSPGCNNSPGMSLAIVQ